MCVEKVLAGSVRLSEVLFFAHGTEGLPQDPHRITADLLASAGHFVDPYAALVAQCGGRFSCPGFFLYRQTKPLFRGVLLNGIVIAHGAVGICEGFVSFYGCVNKRI